MRARSSDQREQRIARQIEVVLAQEEAVGKRREDVRDREGRLTQKEQDLERRRKELDLLWSKRTAELGEREQRVAERERSLDERSKALEEVARRKARVLAEETVSLAERNREVAWRAKAVEAVFPDPPAVPCRGRSTGSCWTRSATCSPLRRRKRFSPPRSGGRQTSASAGVVFTCSITSARISSRVRSGPQPIACETFSIDGMRWSMSSI